MDSPLPQTQTPRHTNSTTLRTVGAPISLRQLLSPATLAANLAASWPLITQFSKRELLNRNKGSSLGIFWTLLHPLLMLAVYTFVFAVVWQARWGVGDVGGVAGIAGHTSAAESKGLFATSVFCGLIVFDVFASGVGAAAGLIVNNSNFVKKVIFPLEVLPLAQIGAGLLVSLISFAILLIANYVLNGKVSATVYLFPLVLVPLLSLTAGTAWFVASLGVFLRDLRQVVTGLLLPVLFFMTPIFYPPERVPAEFRWVVTWNPMAPIVENARRVTLYGQMPDWMSLGIVTLIGLLVMQLGFAFFMKSKRSFADVL